MTLSEEIKKEPYFKLSNLTDLKDCEYAINEWRRLNRKYDYPINKQFASIINKISRKKIELENKQQKISGTMAKLKKGSKEAKEFMAKLRASKKNAVKKAKAVKKTVKTKLKKYKAKAHRIKKAIFSGEKHTDIKSHNYKISIGDLDRDYEKFEMNTIKSLAKSLKKHFEEVKKVFLSDKHMQGIVSSSFFNNGKTPIQTAKLLKTYLIPKISGIKNKSTYDIYFNDEYNSNNKGFKESLEFCKRYIRMYNGTKHSFFADYKNGFVQIVNNQTGNVVYSTKVK